MDPDPSRSRSASLALCWVMLAGTSRGCLRGEVSHSHSMIIRFALDPRQRLRT